VKQHCVVDKAAKVIIIISHSPLSLIDLSLFFYGCQLIKDEIYGPKIRALDKFSYIGQDCFLIVTIHLIKTLTGNSRALSHVLKVLSLIDLFNLSLSHTIIAISSVL
jgi:hypothetical protein